MCGGDHGAKAAKAQLDADNKLKADAIAQQKAIRDQIMATTAKYTEGAGQGFDPAQLALMQSQFLNQNNQNFVQASQGVMAGLRSRGVAGGDSAGGGDLARGLEALQGARASSQSQGILGTNIADLQQALTNKFNALSVNAGQSAQLGQDVSVFQGGTNSDLSDYIKAKSVPGFMSSLATSFAGGIGGSLGKMATGGLSSMFSKIGKGGVPGGNPNGWTS